MSEKTQGLDLAEGTAGRKKYQRNWPVHADQKGATDETKITGLSRGIMQIYREKKVKTEETESSVDNIHLLLEVPRVEKPVQSYRC